MLITDILVFVFGAIIGSGINALDYRAGSNKSWLTDRSECPDCGHKLCWWELIPLVSFFLLGRSCRECSQPISWQYPVVELATGLLYVLIFAVFGLSVQALFAAVVWTLLMLIYVHDGRTFMIPSWAVWSVNLLGLASIFLPVTGGGIAMVGESAWWQLAAGPVLAAPFGLIWYLSAGQAMGLGDGKLTLGIGWLLGLSAGLSAVVYAFWVGAAVSLALLGWQKLWKTTVPSDGKQLTMKSAVPFGPFLILGLLFVYFTGITLL